MKINDLAQLQNLLGAIESWVIKQVTDDLRDGFAVKLYVTTDNVYDDKSLDDRSRNLCLNYLNLGWPWVLLLGEFDGSNPETIPVEIENCSGVVVFSDIWGGIEH